MIVAPVTHYLFYDSIYTERYMALPTDDDNKAGYDAGSAILQENVEKMRGKTFYINHGVADDNVHYQQTMMLVRQLELMDILFQQHSYPEENHSLTSVTTFLYHSFEVFWSQCFEYDIIAHDSVVNL